MPRRGSMCLARPRTGSSLATLWTTEGSAGTKFSFAVGGRLWV